MILQFQNLPLVIVYQAAKIFNINNVLSTYNINIINQYLSTKDKLGYCILDIELYSEIDNLVNEITSIASTYSIETAVNTPFAGTLVPLKHFSKEPRVNSVMLEIRRDQYMDESSMVVDNERINLIKSILIEIISQT